MFDMALNIFYSHAWLDKPIVLPIKAELDAAGFSGWIDKSDIDGGDMLYGKIAEGIYHADVIIVFLSSVYVGRENCRKELSLAGDYKKIILPVLLPGLAWPILPSAGEFAGEMAVHMTGMVYVEATASKIAKALHHIAERRLTLPAGTTVAAGAEIGKTSYESALFKKLELAWLAGLRVPCPLPEDCPFRDAPVSFSIERTGILGAAILAPTAAGTGPRGLVIYIRDIGEDHPLRPTEGGAELQHYDEAVAAQPALSVAVARMYWTGGNEAFRDRVCGKPGASGSAIRGCNVDSLSRKQLLPLLSYIAAKSGEALGTAIARLRLPELMPQTKICIVGVGLGARIAAVALQWLAAKGFTGATAAVDSCILVKCANAGPWCDASMKNVWASIASATTHPLVNIYAPGSNILSRMQDYLPDWTGGPVGFLPLAPHLPPGRVTDLDVAGESKSLHSAHGLGAALMTASFKSVFVSAICSTQS